MKKIILSFIKILSYAWRIVPAGLRRKIFFFMFVLESRCSTPDNALRQLFLIYDKLDDVINERAGAYGKGNHPKHDLTKYHQFFIDRIEPKDKVLDIGCFHGSVAAKVAQNRPDATVIGVEIEADRVEEAKKRHQFPNLQFVQADATKNLPAGKWNVIILSNVLEHIEHRVDFLKKIIAQANPDKILIRLPWFERYWHLPMRKQLGIYYFSDTTHFIEPTLAEFHAEAEAAGLAVVEEITPWGEIWAMCKVKNG